LAQIRSGKQSVSPSMGAGRRWALTVKEKVRSYLESCGVHFDVVTHTETFSSLEEARALGIRADEVAKTLVVRAPGGYILAVVPGGRRLDLKKLREASGERNLRLATEAEMSQDFTEFELGAVPPLGPLVNAPVYMDARLASSPTLVFPGGTHGASVRISGEDLVRVNAATVVDLVREGAEAE
jgi:Ala-tRNA(Pro) deacylase